MMARMDPAIHRGGIPLPDRYRRFGQREARGVSAVYETWAREVAGDEAVLALLDTLPPAKQQPNLVFAAARHHGAEQEYLSFRSTVTGRWEEVRETISTHATQTNEAGRCAVLLPFLAELPQPLALLEVGASAGLCLLPDRYSYGYDDGTAIDPVSGPSAVRLPCALGPGVTAPPALPEVVWRAGIDVAPIDVADDDACSWLETLVWPEQEGRRQRLHAALTIARRDPPRVVRGDLLSALPDLVSEAPADATLVIFHSAVLAYLSADDRARFVELVGAMPGHWISNESEGVIASLPSPVRAPADQGRFLLAVDGQPRALTDPHGRAMSGVRLP